MQDMFAVTRDEQAGSIELLWQLQCPTTQHLVCAMPPPTLNPIILCLQFGPRTWQLPGACLVRGGGRCIWMAGIEPEAGKSDVHCSGRSETKEHGANFGRIIQGPQ